MTEDTIQLEFTKKEVERLVTALAESHHRTKDRGYSFEADRILKLQQNVRGQAYTEGLRQEGYSLYWE